MKLSSVIGLLSGILSILLWIIFFFFNPYSNLGLGFDTFIGTVLVLVLPAFLAIYASIRTKRLLMLLAFIISVLPSLYVMLTPSIFALFGLVNVLYLVSYFLMRYGK